ncbi:MAG TPA: WD40 repeat domain-containing protein [Anaerolineaceae bacterium]|nr:WD40 repeat domain-containing protein [Anaerolineaceae bacterium]
MIDFELFFQILNGSADPNKLQPDLLRLLLSKGIVLSLREDRGAEAITLLEKTALLSPLTQIQDLALQSLVDLAVADTPLASQAIYRLAIEQNFVAAQLAIEQSNIRFADQTTEAVFALIVGNLDLFQKTDPDLKLLTNYFLSAERAIQQVILDAANKAHLKNWTQIVQGIQEGSFESIHDLVQCYSLYLDHERALLFSLLEKMAEQGSLPAQDAICELFIETENPQARAIAYDKAYAPQEAIQRALFYFLSNNWPEYERLDFNSTLLCTAYENANAHLRRRILSTSRYSGQTEWLGLLSTGSHLRWLRDMSDADWEHTLQRLKESNKWEELWQLAQSAPPIWDANILKILDTVGWVPSRDEEKNEFNILIDLIREGLQTPPEIRSPKRLENPPGNAACLAFSPDGRHLVAGRSDALICHWQIPDGHVYAAPWSTPDPQTRTMALSSGAEYLAAASGDNYLRIYYLPEGKLIKTLAGHTNQIRSIILLPDERSMISGGFDGSIRIWRFPQGSEVKSIEAGYGELFALAISPEGHFLLTCGVDPAIRVWSLPDGQLVRKMDGHIGTVTCLVASPSGQIAASYGRDQTIRIWNYQSGRQLTQIDPNASSNTSTKITSLLIHPNEQVLIGATDNGLIKLWSISTGKEILSNPLMVHQKLINSLALSPNGESLVSSSQDGTILLWNLDTFLTSRQPVESARTDSADHIQEKLNHGAININEKNWLTFSMELIRWRQRFDVEVGDFHPIQAGEFDIEL